MNKLVKLPFDMSLAGVLGFVVAVALVVVVLSYAPGVPSAIKVKTAAKP